MRRPLPLLLGASLLLAACAPTEALQRRDAALAEQARYERLAQTPDSLLTPATRAERDGLAARQFELAREVEAAEGEARRHRGANLLLVIGGTVAVVSLLGYLAIIQGGD